MAQTAIDRSGANIVSSDHMQFTTLNTMPDQRRVGDYIGTVSTQGRVTIPEEVRAMLDIQPQDKIVFRVTKESIEISGKLPTLEELAGSVSAGDDSIDLNTVIREAKEERGKQLLHDMQP